MDNPEEILFSGAKIGKDVSPEERRQREREKRQRRGGLDEKPQRPGPPPPETDNQRRTNNPYQDRNDMFGTGDTRRARGNRRRARMQARQESQRNAALPGGTGAANTPAPVTEVPETTRRRRLRPKPQRPS